MGWISADDLHEAYLVPVFDGGDVGLAKRRGPDGLEAIVERVVGERGVTEAERAAAEGVYRGDRRFYRTEPTRADLHPTGEWARPMAEVVGWQLMCDCSADAPPWTRTRWDGPVITRVPSTALERRDVDDPAGLAFYAPDGDILLQDDTPEEELIEKLWHRHHLDAASGTAAIQSAVRDLRAAQRRLDQVVGVARNAGVSWEDVGRAAGMTKQAANSRWRSQSRTIDELEDESHMREMAAQRLDAVLELEVDAVGDAYALVLGLVTPTLAKSEEGRAVWERAWAAVRPASATGD